MKIFIDTNIFLDLILKRENYQEALMIFNAIEKGLYEGVILDITVLNIDYIANKQTKNLKDFLRIINNLFEIVGGTNNLIDEALNIQNSDLEDNLQYIAAKNSQCKLIISNDRNFYRGDLKIVTSTDFLEQSASFQSSSEVKK